MKEWLSLLPSHAAVVWAVIAAVVTAGGVLRGLTGFGASLLMAPVLSLVISARETMCLVILLSALPLGFVGSSGVARLADRALILPLIAAAAIGLPAGIWLVRVMPTHLLGIVLGAVVIVSAVCMVHGLNLARHRSMAMSLSVGALSGVLTGFAGVGGPPAILYVLGVESDNHRARATFIVYFAILYPLALAAVALGGMLPLDELAQGLLMAPLFYLGGRAGERAYRQMGRERYRPLVLVLLICAGCVAILRHSAVDRADRPVHVSNASVLVRMHWGSAGSGIDRHAADSASASKKPLANMSL